jgi:hypothetical protein
MSQSTIAGEPGALAASHASSSAASTARRLASPVSESVYASAST